MYSSDHSGEGGALFTVFFVFCILGLVPAFIASSKGRTFWKWWLYGVVFTPLALVHSIFAKRRDQMGRGAALYTPAPPAPPPPPQMSPVEQLERYAALRERGLLTDEEFNLRKRQILNARP